MIQFDQKALRDCIKDAIREELHPHRKQHTYGKTFDKKRNGGRTRYFSRQSDRMDETG